MRDTTQRQTAPSARPAADGQRRLVSLETAGELYDLHPRTIRRWISRGVITGFRVGRGHQVLRVDLAEIERNAVSVIPAAGRGA